MRPVDLLIPALAAVAALALWWSGWGLVALLLALAAFAATWVWANAHLRALQLWSNDPLQPDAARVWGAWKLPFARLRRFARRMQAVQIDAEQELHLVRTALDRMPDALIVLDPHNHLLWFNDSAARLHALTTTHRPVDQFLRMPELLAYLQRGDWSRPLTTTMPGQAGRTYQVRVVPAPDGTRLIISRDITEQARLDTVRRDFVANVSHEIRTPLTVVSGFIETLIDLDLPRGEALAYLQSARHNAETMDRLLADLLTLSSLEHSGTNRVDEWIDMPQALAGWVNDANSLSAGRHEVILDVESRRPLFAVRAEIETAVRNLLTNAIRYTPDGGRIRVSWRQDARTGTTQLSVRDTGIGIAAEHLPRLTERFYRVDRSRSRDTGGTGLGLAIVKHIAQRHQAELHVESRLGSGSCFTLDFPADRIGDGRAPGAAA